MILQPHHDGSELYVSNIAPKIGEEITLKVRVPAGYLYEKAFIRVYEDGEPRSYELIKRSKGKNENWLSVGLRVINLHVTYRFIFVAKGKYETLNAIGFFDHDVHSNNDFKIVAAPAYPDWIRSSVFYQIFPDRFAKSGDSIDYPDWAHPRAWNESPRARSRFTGTELYGGDLKGVEKHLDYLIKLGINGIYFTPFFPARSNHRYDANSFDEVDPVLGGNKALFSLVKAANKANIRILGDLTSNHCGAGHPWLKKALKSKHSQERSFFYWDKSSPHGYVGWWGLESMPKFNFNSKVLRSRLYAGKNSIVRRWISPKFGLSGWRIDVGNMTGKYGSDDLHDEVMRGIRKAMDETNPDTWLVAENGDFNASDLDGFGWHGAMNYQGFMRPVWNWFNSNSEIGGGFQGLPFEMPKITGVQLVHSMRQFNGSVPWRSVVASMILLDSHDTARFRTVVKDNIDVHKSAMTLLLTYPGVPSIFAGDEIGLQGSWGEDSRRTINWENQNSWDLIFLDEVTKLIKIRTTSDALINGGLRWVEIKDDYIVFLRESKKQSFLVIISRKGIKVKVELGALGLSVTRTLYGPVQEGSTINVESKEAIQGIWEVK